MNTLSRRACLRAQQSLLGVFCLFLVSCDQMGNQTSVRAPEPPPVPSRFTVECVLPGTSSYCGAFIYTDTQTGVKYLSINHGLVVMPPEPQP